MEPQEAEYQPRRLMTLDDRMKLFEREPYCRYLSKLEDEHVDESDREYVICLACDLTIM